LVGAAVAVPLVVAAFVLGLAVSSPSSGVAYAQAPAVQPVIAAAPIVTPDGESPFVKVASDVIPVVVNIATETKPAGGSLDDFWPKDFPFPFQIPQMPQAPQAPRGHGLGSGVLVSADGYIVTNNHVISEAEDITVTLSDKTVFKGEDVKVVGTDPATDIALLKVKTEKQLPFADWADSDSVKVGEWAIAVGNPYGLSGTVTVGVISAKGRSGIPLSAEQRIQDFIQTDASINPGNSGGALVNIKGKLIGINSAIRSPVGANVGIGFAVPTNLARQVVDQLRTSGRIAHGYLGIKPQEVTESVKDAMGLESTEGVLVGEVVDKTPAKKAGLQVGDVITRFDGRDIQDVPHFRSLVASMTPGRTVKIDFVRDGKKLSASTELAELPKDVAAGTPTKPATWNGLAVEDLSASDREKYDVSTGAIVKSVAPGSAAAQAGFQANDVIVKVTVKAKDISEKIESAADFARVTGQLEGYKKAVAVQVRRNRSTQIITVTPGK
jgi:serine protease Do